MPSRTDLAAEIKNFNSSKELKETKTKKLKCVITNTEITADDSKIINKPAGNYILIEPQTNIESDSKAFIKCIRDELKKIIPKGPILVAGLGNRSITPDALGPKSADKILATRHVRKVLEDTFKIDEMRDVSVVTPGVLGNTGVEAADYVRAVSDMLKPSCIIAIDALASKSISHLCRSVQITDTGISPGSGIGNRRAALNNVTTSIPVIAIGVPTVIDGATFVSDLLKVSDDDKQKISEMVSPNENLILTLKDIDMKISVISLIIAQAVNTALNTDITEDEFALLTQY